VADEDNIHRQTGLVHGFKFAAVEGHLLEVLGHQFFLLELDDLGFFGLLDDDFSLFFLDLRGIFLLLRLGDKLAEIEPASAGLLLLFGLLPHVVHMLLGEDGVIAHLNHALEEFFVVALFFGDFGLSHKRLSVETQSFPFGLAVLVLLFLLSLLFFAFCFFLLFL
jgi:hypothetical protein